MIKHIVNSYMTLTESIPPLPILRGEGGGGGGAGAAHRKKSSLKKNITFVIYVVNCVLVFWLSTGILRVTYNFASISIYGFM